MHQDILCAEGTYAKLSMAMLACWAGFAVVAARRRSRSRRCGGRLRRIRGLSSRRLRSIQCLLLACCEETFGMLLLDNDVMSCICSPKAGAGSVRVEEEDAPLQQV